jgi:hypothetical protein
MVKSKKLYSPAQRAHGVSLSDGTWKIAPWQVLTNQVPFECLLCLVIAVRVLYSSPVLAGVGVKPVYFRDASGCDQLFELFCLRQAEL